MEKEGRQSTARDLKGAKTKLFPPPRPVIRTLDTERLDAIDAQKTVTKEASKSKRETMEEIKKLEKELSEVKERNMRYNLRWHKEVQAEKAKVVMLELKMAQSAQKASGSAPPEREIILEEKYVSGGEEELAFTKATPSTHTRNLMRKETAQRYTEASLGDRDTMS